MSALWGVTDTEKSWTGATSQPAKINSADSIAKLVMQTGRQLDSRYDVFIVTSQWVNQFVYNPLVFVNLLRYWHVPDILFRAGNLHRFECFSKC